jgi:hypothetical protein
LLSLPPHDNLLDGLSRKKVPTILNILSNNTQSVEQIANYLKIKHLKETLPLTEVKTGWRKSESWLTPKMQGSANC